MLDDANKRTRDAGRVFDFVFVNSFVLSQLTDGTSIDAAAKTTFVVVKNASDPKLIVSSLNS